jgi:hypothetical protein
VNFPFQFVPAEAEEKRLVARRLVGITYKPVQDCKLGAISQAVGVTSCVTIRACDKGTRL